MRNESLTGAGPVAGINVCDMSDACDRLGLPAVRVGAITRAYSGCAAIAGTVMTVRLDTGDGAPLAELLDAFAASSDDVILVDLAGRTDVQCFGTVLATAARQCQKAGAIVNGAVRDVDGLAALGFPVYARGVHPAAMTSRLAFAGAGHDVRLDAGVVRPGSAVAAGDSGVVFFPRERLADVMATAREIAAAEQELLAKVASANGPNAALALLRG